MVIHSMDTFEEKEDFTTETQSKYQLSVQTPWEAVRELSGRLVHVNSGLDMKSSMNLVCNDDRVDVDAVINVTIGVHPRFSLIVSSTVDSIVFEMLQLGMSESVVTMKHTSMMLPRGEMLYQMNSTWGISDNGINVQGTFESEVVHFESVTWKVIHTTNDDDDDRYDPLLHLK